MKENPYRAPGNQHREEEIVTENYFEDDAETAESLENLKFTAKIVRVVSVLCGVGSLVYFAVTLLGFRYLDFQQWSWIHTTQVFRLLFAPSLATLCFLGWKYSNSMRRLANSPDQSFVQYINAQAYFWLAVALYVFLLFCGAVLSFSLSYFYSNGEF